MTRKTATTSTLESVLSQGPFGGSTDWMTKASEFSAAPVRLQQLMLHEAVATAARSAHSFAEYLEDLSKIDSPVEALARHTAWLQKVAADSIAESTALLDLLRKLPKSGDSDISAHATPL